VAVASEPTDDRVTVALAEYHALRHEIVASLGMQQTTLSFSTLALGGVAAAGFHALPADKDASLPLLIFLLIVPLVSYVSLFIWLGEYARTTRAGSFLRGVEERINGLVGERLLTWEHWLRAPGGDGRPPQYAWNACAIFGFYGLMPLVSTLVAGLTMRSQLSGIAWAAYTAGEIAVWTVLVLVFLRGEFNRALVDAGARPIATPAAATT
jgi:hypothetical protein